MRLMTPRSCMLTTACAHYIIDCNIFFSRQTETRVAVLVQLPRLCCTTQRRGLPALRIRCTMCCSCMWAVTCVHHRRCRRSVADIVVALQSDTRTLLQHVDALWEESGFHSWRIRPAASPEKKLAQDGVQRRQRLASNKHFKITQAAPQIGHYPQLCMRNTHQPCAKQ